MNSKRGIDKFSDKIHNKSFFCFLLYIFTMQKTEKNNHWVVDLDIDPKRDTVIKYIIKRSSFLFHRLHKYLPRKKNWKNNQQPYWILQHVSRHHFIEKTNSINLFSSKKKNTQIKICSYYINKKRQMN